MVKKKSLAIRTPRSNTRTGKQTARLFAGLESFVNLGDSFEDYCAFASQWPTFCPMAFQNSSGELLLLFPNRGCHTLVIQFRDFLRLVWRRDGVALREQVLKILLGMEYRTVGHEPLADAEEEVEWVPIDASTPEALAKSQQMRDKAREQMRRGNDEKRRDRVLREYDPRIRLAMWGIMHDRETGYSRPWRPLLVADWERGEFFYEPMNDFQRAVYTLFRQSWRARICRECQRLFIADKNPQMFCGTDCSVIARRRRDLASWRKRVGKSRAKGN